MGFDMFLCPAHNNFLIDIGLPYLAHGSITMKVCITYIHDPDTMLTFDLKVKFIGFMTYGFVFGHQLFRPLTLPYFVWHVSVLP